MAPGLESSVGIVAYLALFSAVGVVFLFANLFIGKFVRPANPHPEKLEIYECGEPTIGSSFVQFDLRFYVVALLFIIFDVEVAFFFPWATVFGKSTNLSQSGFQVIETQGANVQFTQNAKYLLQEIGVRHPVVPVNIPRTLETSIPRSASNAARAEAIVKQSANELAIVTLIDIVLFFFILMVGFAYVWKRGDLDWVRAVSRERSQRGSPSEIQLPQEHLISA